MQDRPRIRSGPARWWLALAAVVLLAACSSRDGAADGPDRRAEADAASTTSTTDASRTTTTIDAGAPPTSPSVQCAGTLDGPTTEEYRELPGVTPSLTSLDVYRRPGATGCPAVIWVHGGGWATGDKRGKAIDKKVAWAGELGAVLVSVNYRLATPGSDVGWPDIGEDVAAATAWVLDHADVLGVDPSRVALMGHSAGAHLVTIVATHPDLLRDVGVDRAEIACVVALDSASYDLTAEDQDSRALIRSAFGTDPTTLADASPILQLQLDPGGVPDTLVVTRGSAARVGMAEELAAAIRATGATSEVLDATPYTHEEVNTLLGTADDAVMTPVVDDFLTPCLA